MVLDDGPAGEVSCGIETERLEFETVGVAAGVFPNSLAGRFQSLWYAGGRVNHGPAGHEYRQGIEASNLSSRHAIADRDADVPRPFEPAPQPVAALRERYGHSDGEDHDQHSNASHKPRFSFHGFASHGDLFQAKAVRPW